jgi:hypothetical protein
MKQPDTESQYADAFGPVALANGAISPNGAHLFRAQHEVIIRALADVTACAEAGYASEETALRAHSSLARAISALNVHQFFESTMVRRVLAVDPRVRMLVDQFEREMAPLQAEFAAFLRKYPVPSSIIKAPTDFAHTFSSLLLKLHERFRLEEREVFPAFDRVVRPGAPSAALLADA